MVPRGCIVHNLDLPVVFCIADCQVAIARHFVIRLCDWSGHGVGVQIAAGLDMEETDDIHVTDESYILLNVWIRFIAIREEKPVIVGILVMVARDLLL